jgi:oxygen-independent coproporphyrinogen-3 oxidase
MSAAAEHSTQERLDSEARRMGMGFPAKPEEGEWRIEKYFANEGVDPLSHAFDGKIAVHPGVGGGMVPPPMIEKSMEPLLENPRTGTSVAYIHVPFCETHCLYCGFYNKGYSKEESARYTDTLIKELQLWSSKPVQQQGGIHAVYLGGGTPTALEACDIERLLKSVHQYLPLANDCEITVEGRLHNFGTDKMEACFAGGANRFSLGVQSFSTKIRQTMGRLAPREEVMRRLEVLKSYNQAAVIVDLIFGFPMQSMDVWLDDIDAACSMELDGMDCYQLNVYGQTPLGKAIKEGKLPPSADSPMQSAMFAAGVEKLQNAFYRRLSLTHWARTSRERNLYNQYVKGRAHCLAFGPGAGGNISGWFYMNQHDYKTWQDTVNDSRKPMMVLTRPNPYFYFFRAITESMEQGWVDFAHMEQCYSVQILTALQPLLQQWMRAGLITMRGNTMILTLAGQFWQVNLSQLLQDFLKHTLESK